MRNAAAYSLLQPEEEALQTQSFNPQSAAISERNWLHAKVQPVAAATQDAGNDAQEIKGECGGGRRDDNEWMCEITFKARGCCFPSIGLGSKGEGALVGWPARCRVQ